MGIDEQAEPVMKIRSETKPTFRAPRMNRWVVIALLLCGLLAAECVSRVIRPDISWHDTDKIGAAGLARFRAALDGYASQRASLRTPERVAGWLRLVDLYSTTGGSIACGDANDVLAKLMGVLPPASDWPELDRQIRSRAGPAGSVDPRELLLRGVGAYLTGRTGDLQKSADALVSSIGLFGWNGGDFAEMLSSLAHWMAGDRKSALARLEKTLTGHQHRRRGHIEAPDLFEILPEDQARSLLRRAMLLKYPIRVPSGGRTEVCARELAVSLAAQLQVPQWWLARSIDAGEVYEASERTLALLASRDPDSCRNGLVHRDRAEALPYRLADLIRRGRVAEARSLIGQESDWTTNMISPANQLAECEDAAGLQALERLLWDEAQKAPEPAWRCYEHVATLVGRTDQIVDVLRRAMSKAVGWSAAWVREALCEQLLAEDRIDEALVELRAYVRHVEKMGSQERGSADRWFAGALRMVELGILLARQDVVDEGLAELGRCPASARLDACMCDGSRADAPALLHRVGRDDEAIGLCRRRLAVSGKQVDLLALVGALFLAGKHRDVLQLLDSSTAWEATDVADLVAADAGGIPFGLAIAASLKAVGRPGPAAAVAERLLQVQPHCDGAYEILLEVRGPAIVDLLQELGRRNPREDRPLVWQAALLLQQGRVATARPLLSRAIEMNPFDDHHDGQDQMRAHRMLAKLDGSSRKDLAKQLKAAEFAALGRRMVEAHLLHRGIELLRAAVELVPSHSSPRLELAQALSAAGRPGEARVQYKAAFSAMQGIECGACLSRGGCSQPQPFRWSAAVPVADEVLRTAARPAAGAGTARIQGRLFEHRGQLHAAARAYQEAVRIDPDDMPSWLRLAELAEAEQRRDAWLPIDYNTLARILLRLHPAWRSHEGFLSRVSDPVAIWPDLERVADLERRRVAPLLPIPRGSIPARASRDADLDWRAPASVVGCRIGIFPHVVTTLRDLRVQQPGLIGTLIRWCCERVRVEKRGERP